MAKKEKDETEEAAAEQPATPQIDGEIDGTQTPSPISDDSQKEQ